MSNLRIDEKTVKELRNMLRAMNQKIGQKQYDGRCVTTRERTIRCLKNYKVVIEKELCRRGHRKTDRKRNAPQAPDGNVPPSPADNVLPFTQRTVH